jgi:hypothetical protein
VKKAVKSFKNRKHGFEKKKKFSAKNSNGDPWGSGADFQRKERKIFVAC